MEAALKCQKDRSGYKFFNHIVNIRYCTLLIWIFSYLILAAVIFLFGWVKLWISLPVSLLVVAAMIFAVRKDENVKAKKNIQINVKSLIIFIALFLFITWISGSGGFYYQSDDYHWRNAVLRDLINYDWPVVYPTGNMLLYYIGYWLPAALVGKLFGFFAANVVCFIWTFLGLFLTFLLLCFILNIKTLKAGLVVILILVIFGGLDFIGVIFSRLGPEYFITEIMHMEWWLEKTSFTSNLAQIMFVFNQSLAVWLIAGLLFMQQKPCNYVFCVVLVLPYGPLAVISLVGICIIKFGAYLYQRIKAKGKGENKIFTLDIIKECFTFQNIIALLTLFPIFLIYYLASSAIGAPASVGYVPWQFKGIEYFLSFLAFCLLEFLVYYFIMFKRFKKDPLFHGIVILLFFIPFFNIGTNSDFALKVSIAPLFLLMIYVMKFFLGQKPSKEPIDAMVNPNVTPTTNFFKMSGARHLKMLLVMVLMIAAINPAVEQIRAVRTMVAERRIDAVADDIVTFEDVTSGDENFVCYTYQDSLFYKLLMKR